MAGKPIPADVLVGPVKNEPVEDLDDVAHAIALLQRRLLLKRASVILAPWLYFLTV